MADQFNDSIPAVTNQITEDVADIAETLGYLKDVFQAFCNLWSGTVATNIKPKVMGDADNDTLIQCEETADEDIIRFDIGGTGNVATLTATGFTVLGVAQGNDVTAALHRKIVEIGDWNMDSAAYVSIAHGLTASKIRVVSGLVRADDGSTWDGTYVIGSDSVNPLYFDMANPGFTNGSIVIRRAASSIFDSTSFDGTSYNRGWITIDYVD